MSPCRLLLERLCAKPFLVPPVLDQPLAPLTSLKAGAKAGLFVQPSNEGELEYLFAALLPLDLPWFLVGKGSNLVCRDQDFPGVLVQLTGEFGRLSQNQRELQAGAGAVDAKVARFARQCGLGGAEWLVTVPGSLGGAVAMNAGAYGQDIAGMFAGGRAFDPAKGFVDLSPEDLAFGYRSSRLQKTGEILLSARLALTPKEPEVIRQLELEYLKKRRLTQPTGIKTFGSIFKNPPGTSAWKLIDQAGLRGRQIGSFRISPVHANFMENLGQGEAKGLIELIETVQSEVQAQTGVKLDLEGKLFPPEP